jgi:RND family efflux transporter MFP subunit
VFATIFERIWAIVRAVATAFVEFANRVGWWKIGIAGAVVIVGGLAAHAYIGPSTPVPALSIRQVEVRSVAALAAESSPLEIVGTVSAKSEATVLAESSGRITRAYYGLGDVVGAGASIVALENASQQAALLQAQGAQDAAQAALDKVKSGARAEEKSTLQASLNAGQQGAVNALLSAYTAVDNAIRGTTDPFFISPNGVSPRFKILAYDSQVKINAEDGRIALNSVLAREKTRAADLSTDDDLHAEFDTTTTEVRQVRDFLDTVIATLNAGIAAPEYPQSTIDAYLSDATAARASINTVLSTLSSAHLALQMAENNLKESVVGARPEDIAAAEAALKQAQGSVAAARASLEKTIVRAPISGTINSFSLKVGDHVSQGSPVVTVANNSALEVIAYVSESDAREIAVGQNVSFDSGAKGIVTKIAPALDPVTKRIEVRIGISDPGKTLLNGQSILARIERVAPGIAVTSRITIPISAVKVEADRTTVFTVGADSALVAHEVKLGALLGDRIEITEGVSADMQIVTDARGLREGQSVEAR